MICGGAVELICFMFTGILESGHRVFVCVTSDI